MSSPASLTDGRSIDRGPRIIGAFCWHELHTRERARAADFYIRLIGWSTSDKDGYAEWVTKSQSRVGGMMEIPPGPPDSGPAQWAVYINVEDVDDAAKRAAALGGRILAPPIDIPNIGRLCGVADPTGASFYLFKGLGECGVQQPETGEGVFCRTELLTHDTASAKRFYTQLLGWTTTSKPVPTGEYIMLWLPSARPERMEGCVGGMMENAPEWGPMSSCWLSYIQVADIDATASMIVPLGGTVVCPPTDIANIGRFAIGKDPTGALFAIYMSLR